MERRLIRRLLGVTALAAVVAVGAGGGSTWAPLRFGRPGAAALVMVLSVAMVVGIVGAWIVTAILQRGSPKAGARSPGPLLRSVDPRRVAPTAVVGVAVAGLLGITLLGLGTPRPEAADARERGPGREGKPLVFWDTRSSPVRAGGEREEAPGTMDRRPVPMAAAILVLVLGGAVLAWWWVGKRSAERAARPVEDIDPEAARGTVLRSIEAMLADPDPNTAIIGAYARLLEGLADAGVPREDYEGPVEHLRRALTHLRVRPGPVHHLVDLFEVARFSTTALTHEDRDEALAALRQVASELGHEPDHAVDSNASHARERIG